MPTSGRFGWGADCQVRELEGGESVARGCRVYERPSGGGGIFFSAGLGRSMSGTLVMCATIDRM